MPEQQRRALLLREWQGLSYREIAEEMRLTQAAVETLLFRARRSLADALTAAPGKTRGRGRPRLSGSFGPGLAALKSLLVGGGVKVAATAATVAATSVVASTPVVRRDIAEGVMRSDASDRPAAARPVSSGDLPHQSFAPVALDAPRGPAQVVKPPATAQHVHVARKAAPVPRLRLVAAPRAAVSEPDTAPAPKETPPTAIVAPPAPAPAPPPAEPSPPPAAAVDLAALAPQATPAPVSPTVPPPAPAPAPVAAVAAVAPPAPSAAPAAAAPTITVDSVIQPADPSATNAAEPAAAPTAAPPAVSPGQAKKDAVLAAMPALPDPAAAASAPDDTTQTTDWVPPGKTKKADEAAWAAEAKALAHDDKGR